MHVCMYVRAFNQLNVDIWDCYIVCSYVVQTMQFLFLIKVSPKEVCNNYTIMMGAILCIANSKLFFPNINRGAHTISQLCATD